MAALYFAQTSWSVSLFRKKFLHRVFGHFVTAMWRKKGLFLFHNCMWNPEYFFFQWLRNHITEKQRRKFWKLKLDFIKIAKIAKIAKLPKSLAQSRNTNAFERQFPISITANRWAGCLWWKQCSTQPSSSTSPSSSLQNLLAILAWIWRISRSLL